MRTIWEYIDEEILAKFFAANPKFSEGMDKLTDEFKSEMEKAKLEAAEKSGLVSKENMPLLIRTAVTGIVRRKEALAWIYLQQIHQRIHEINANCQPSKDSMREITEFYERIAKLKEQEK